MCLVLSVCDSLPYLLTSYRRTVIHTWLTAEAYIYRQVSTNFALFKNKIDTCNFRINWEKTIILLVLNWHWTLSLIQREVYIYTLYRKRLRTECCGELAWREEREIFEYQTDLHKWKVCSCYIIPDVVKMKRTRTKWSTEIGHTWEVCSIKCYKTLIWEFSRI